MKKCCKCGVERSIGEYVFCATEQDLLNPFCKTCDKLKKTNLRKYNKIRTYEDVFALMAQKLGQPDISITLLIKKCSNCSKHKNIS
jgi:hypothetical protein